MKSARSQRRITKWPRRPADSAPNTVIPLPAAEVARRIAIFVRWRCVRADSRVERSHRAGMQASVPPLDAPMWLTLSSGRFCRETFWSRDMPAEILP
jgi:hypothetical protein